MKSTLKVVGQGITSAVLLAWAVSGYAANAVVSSPCGEAQFNTAFNTVNAGSGGTLTFNCGGAKTITFTSGKNVAAPVTIDGANLITLDGNNSVYFFQVFSGKSLTLKNLTLQHGSFNTAHALESFGNLVLNHVTVTANSSSGSAVQINSGSLTVVSSTFSGNVVQTGVSSDTHGAAIQVSSMADVQIFDSTFSNNNMQNHTAGSGGAIALADGTLSITRSIFSSNQALDGGAIQLGAGSALIEHSTFANNQAGYGGAIEDDGASFDIRTTTFSTNTAANDGGAIWLLFGSASAVSMVDRSQFSGNKANAAGGGAISCYSGANNALDALNSSFNGNQSGGHGGAIYAGCQFYTENSTYYNNTAGATSGGGGLYHTGDSLFHAYRVTIANNKALYGAGIANSSSGVYTPYIGYSIVTANTIGATLTVDNCSGAFPVTDDGYNVSDGMTCGGAFTAGTDKLNANLPMQAFGNYGGPTSTLPPASGNDAINRIPSGFLCPADHSVKDQRGALRPASGSSACDSGAFELNGIIDEIFADAFEQF